MNFYKFKLIICMTACHVRFRPALLC